MGLERNLSAGELFEQLDWAQQEAFAAKIPLRNAVFMGMGEPFHNFDTVTEALERMISPKGYGFGPRKITVSTIGVIERMLPFAARFPQVRLALSLHSAIEEKRKQLVPRSHATPDELRSTIRELNSIDPTSTVWLEYVLLEGINDGVEDLSSLIEFTDGLSVEINVIPYNNSQRVPKDSPTEATASDRIIQANRTTSRNLCRPSQAAIDSFVRQLRAAGIFTTLRKSLGQSIDAACGQLVVP